MGIEKQGIGKIIDIKLKKSVDKYNKKCLIIVYNGLLKKAREKWDDKTKKVRNYRENISYKEFWDCA